MPMKCWEADIEGHTIRIENAWTGEKLLVDGKLQDEQNGVKPRGQLEGTIPGSQLGCGRIKVSLGGIFTIGCTLFVDDKKVALKRVP
jgi:hypothetical protein